METTALTISERKEHMINEEIIASGLKAFYEVGSALLRIRDTKSYRDTHETFEAYCKERWDLSRPYAYQQIDAAGVVNDVSAIADIKPSKEAQCRPLASLTTEDRQAVWQRILDSGDKITAKRITHEVQTYFNELSPDPETPGSPKPKPTKSPTGDQESDLEKEARHFREEAAHRRKEYEELKARLEAHDKAQVQTAHPLSGPKKEALAYILKTARREAAKLLGRVSGRVCLCLCWF